MGNRLAIFAALVAALLTRFAAADPPPSVSESQATNAAVVVLNGQIDDFTKRTLTRHFDRARAEGARTVILEIDTYGGVVTSALEISHYLKQSDLHTIAYINTKAYSAGALIAVACDEIVMAPTAAIGDCAPISMRPDGGLEVLPPTEREKSESPIRADFRDSALRNGYDPLLLESMVSLDRVVHYVQKDERRQFVNAEQYAKLSGDGWSSVDGVPDPVDAAGTLLTVNTDLARKLGLAKGTATSAQDLASQRNLAIVATYSPSTGQKFVETLNNPFLRSILLTIFLTALYAAFHMPGHGAPEVIATIAMAVLLVVPLMTGYGQWWEVAAILVGVVLLAVEIFVLPGFGVAGVTGLVLLLGGFLMTFVAPEPGRSPISLPSLPVSWAGVQRGLTVLLAGLVLSFFASWWLRQFLPKMPFARRLLLTAPVGGSDRAMAGSLSNIDPNDLNPAVGSHGTALTDLRPGGTAQFTDPAGGIHSVSVVSEDGFLPRGTTLLVLEARGSRVVVRKAPQDSDAAAV